MTVRRRLAAPTERPAAFDPGMVAGLPDAARRWLLHAIAPGTPLTTGALLRMRGAIRLGAWRPFTAAQVLRPPEGFLWSATARVAGLPVIGHDRYDAGVGEMRWRLLGAIPVLSASGPDVTRSAAGRLAGELVLDPAAALTSAVTFEHVDDRRVRAHVTIGGEAHPVTLTVAPDGALTSVTLPRWGNPDKGPYREHVFGAEFLAERTFGGFTVPSRVRVGWWYGTDRWDEGEFFRFTLWHAAFV
ncbi:hypothetical protein BTM25_46980 [Actinomadura rubteroloni]|uniref:Uncharacterized protein n=1 Tax=Actinomadura rubteroloni TaxID=1926885 RepID=A0A2P4UEP8_9ACTN|nr:DUF6544 family protein [Actinomadura rubteroloni]POM23544.1 hypothetical protein BTM25_46980 [Actinomadura rubteroloni]